MRGIIKFLLFSFRKLWNIYCTKWFKQHKLTLDFHFQKCRTIELSEYRYAHFSRIPFLTMTFWMWIPDTIKNGAILADMEQSIWHSDDVEMCLLFIWEIRIGNPNIRHHPLIKFKVTEITQVLKVQAWINPGLSQEHLHG